MAAVAAPGAPHPCTVKLLESRPDSVLQPAEQALLLYGVAILVGVLAHGAWRAYQAHGTFVHWASSCRSGQDTATETNEIERCVAQGMRAREEANVSSSVSFMRFGGLVSVAIVCVNLVRQADRFLTLEQCCLNFTVTTVAWVAYALRPQALQSRPGLVFNAIMAYVCGFVLSAGETPVLSFLSETLTCIVRVVIGAKYFGMRSIAFWSIACPVASVASLVRSMGPEALVPLLAYEVFMVGAMASVSYVAARDAERQVRVQVQASALRSDNLGSWNLLELVCDVAVPLDEGLRISDTALRFSALVMMQGRSMEGALLQDFMLSAADREALERCTSAAEPGHTGVLHVTFRDTLGNALRAELFCVTFERLERRRYLVGIRELSDTIPTALEARMPHIRRTQPEAAAAATPRSGAPEAMTPRSGAPPAADPDLISLSSFEPGASVTSAPTSCLTDDVVAAPPPLPRMAADTAEPAPTSSAAVEMALLQLMRLVSLPPAPQGRGGACCPYHAVAAVLLVRLKRLRSQPCLRCFKPHFDVQCAHCGFLADLPEGPRSTAVCFACEEDVGRPPARAAPWRLSM